MRLHSNQTEFSLPRSSILRTTHFKKSRILANSRVTILPVVKTERLLKIRKTKSQGRQDHRDQPVGMHFSFSAKGSLSIVTKSDQRKGISARPRDRAGLGKDAPAQQFAPCTTYTQGVRAFARAICRHERPKPGTLTGTRC